MTDIDTSAWGHNEYLFSAWCQLIQAYDVLRADGDHVTARRVLALAKQVDRAHSKLIARDNADVDALFDAVAEIVEAA